jgi:glycosyltransferase involved in cell wall biosynthesis
MYRDHTVAVVVPAYNEEGFVGDVIADLPEFVDRAYIVDDGSTDGTWDEIRRNATRRNREHDGHFDDLVVPIQHAENRGVGGAIKTGYLRACEEEIDVTAVLGGDDQMNPEVLTNYLDPIVDGVAGYAKGNRFAREEDYAEMPRFRLLGNVILSYLTKIASGYWESMDSQNGYTAISLDALERTDIEGMYEYYGYCNDLLVRLNAADVVVADVPRSSEYAYSEGWKSHIDYTEYIPRVSLMLLSSFLWRLRRKYLLGDFHPLALLYLLGSGVLTAAGTALVASLARRRDSASTWFLSAVFGALTVVAASVLDWDDNANLQIQLDAGETEARETGDGGIETRSAAANGDAHHENGQRENQTTDGSDSDNSPEDDRTDGVRPEDDVTFKGAR